MLNDFLKMKSCKIMMLLKEENEGKKGRYLSELAKQSNCSYVHITNLVKKLEANGLVKTEKKGRERLVVLTEEGLKTANIISEVVNRLSGIGAAQQYNKQQIEENKLK